MNATLARTLDVAVAIGIYGLMRHRGVENDPEEVAAYAEQWGLGKPEVFFAVPDQPLELPLPPKIRPRQFWQRRAYWTYDTLVDSTIETPFAVNNRQHAHWYLPREGHPKGSVIFLHGVLASSYLGYEWIVRELVRAGWRVLFVHLPYHLKRTPKGYWPGEFFVLGNVVRSMEMARQGVIELRRLISALSRERHGSIGVVGISMGGWYGGLLATVEPLLDFAALVVPALDLRTIYSESLLGLSLRRFRSPFPLDRLNHILLSLSPMYSPLVLPADRLLLATGDWDLLVPTHTIEEARSRWKPGSFRTYPGGHISLAFNSQLWADLVEFADRCAGLQRGQEPIQNEELSNPSV